jgi:hypothetical protein
MIPLLIPQVHENDVGTRLRFLVKRSAHFSFDLSTATGVFVVFRRPDRTSFVVNGTLEQPEDSARLPGQDGVFYYDTQDGDLVPAGDWYIQGMVALPIGTWATSIVSMRVYPNLLAVLGPDVEP